MRSAELGLIPRLSEKFTKRESLELFRKICLCRSFEKAVAKAYDSKIITGFPIYLSLGQEAITAGLSLALPKAKQLGQHRCHDIYICWSGNLRALRDELKGLPTGCAQGMGGSASIHSPETGMIGHDGFMGTQVPIACGYAMGLKETCIAIMGDASAEEGFVLGPLGEASTKKDRVLFVCYDNNLSIKTEVKVRRNWSVADEALSKGVLAIDITDDPWLVAYWAKLFSKNLPALMNVRTCRELWHAGTGCDGPPEWNRFELVKKEMANLGLAQEASTIEEMAKLTVQGIWEENL